jgi:DNA-binding transcriptional ArsR family regulator
VIETFTALAEPSRLRIVELLKDGPRPVGESGTRLRLSQPQVSKHLRVLKAARLVDVEPRANQRLYGLRGDRLRDLNKWLENYRAIWGERMDQLDELVQELEASTPNNTARSVGEGRSTLRQPRERTPAQGPLKNEDKNARRRKKGNHDSPPRHRGTGVGHRTRVEAHAAREGVRGLRRLHEA